MGYGEVQGQRLRGGRTLRAAPGGLRTPVPVWVWVMTLVVVAWSAWYFATQWGQSPPVNAKTPTLCRADESLPLAAT